MIHSLTIRDYGTIAVADLTLAPFTVIVGRNRSGKSTILRALRSLVFNKMYGTFRHGKTSCSVQVRVDENEILWSKTKVTSSYQMGGQVYSKLAGGVPSEIAGALGIRAVEVDSTLTLVPQLHQQGEYAFLLDKPSGQAARALAKMTRLDVVVQAQQLSKAKVKEYKDELKAIGANIDRTAGEIAGCPNPMSRLIQLNGDLMEVKVLRRAFQRYLEGKEANEVFINELLCARAGKVIDSELASDIEDYDNAVLALATIQEMEKYPEIVLTPRIQEEMATLYRGVTAYNEWWEASGERGEQESALKQLERERKQITADLPEVCPVCGK